MAPALLLTRGPKGHINIRILHSGSKGHIEGGYQKSWFEDPCVYVALLGS